MSSREKRSNIMKIITDNMKNKFEKMQFIYRIKKIPDKYTDRETLSYDKSKVFLTNLLTNKHFHMMKYVYNNNKKHCGNLAKKHAMNVTKTAIMIMMKKCLLIPKMIMMQMTKFLTKMKVKIIMKVTITKVSTKLKQVEILNVRI